MNYDIEKLKMLEGTIADKCSLRLYSMGRRDEEEHVKHAEAVKAAPIEGLIVYFRVLENKQRRNPPVSIMGVPAEVRAAEFNERVDSVRQEIARRVAGFSDERRHELNEWCAKYGFDESEGAQ